jgi:hypothetical protein
MCFWHRLRSDKKSQTAPSLYDYSLFIVASLNVICHVSAAFSRQLFDGPFFFAELSKTTSYVVMLGGALLDQARLFDQVRSMAVTDPLTGLQLSPAHQRHRSGTRSFAPYSPPFLHRAARYGWSKNNQRPLRAFDR